MEVTVQHRARVTAEEARQRAVTARSTRLFIWIHPYVLGMYTSSDELGSFYSGL